MDITPREKFGFGSSFKKFVRKVIPNEVSKIAVKAAPFVAPFNPLLAAGMAGIGGFDQTGSISKSLRSGALTYGLGNLARVLGGAGPQFGLKAQGAGQGFGSYFTSPTSGQQLFGAKPETFTPSGTSPLASEPSIAGASPVSDGQYLPTDFATKSLPLEQATTGLTNASGNVAKQTTGNLLKSIVNPESTLAERSTALKELGGKALKSIYTKQVDGKTVTDKFAIAATVSGVGSYMEAKKLAEEAGLVEEGDEYTEEMYEADKAKYADKYAEYLTPEAFGLKEGGRVNFLNGGDTSYNAMITEMYIKAGGGEGTGMDIDSFAEKYFPKMKEGGRVNLEAGGIPSITLEEIKEKDPKDYNFMELIDTDAEDEYYIKRAEELDRKYNPQNYTQVLPKEKPMDQYMLNEIMGDKGMNTLSEDTRDMAMKMYAEKAFKKGQISEAEYNEIMGIEKKANGGIMGVRNKYAMGSEVPIRENQAGVNEMDFRETGGFVPPIGVKEKADDIPAMLSNNEFVFTADAVRAAGGGSVNKGAQRMYNMMKSLEGKVV